MAFLDWESKYEINVVEVDNQHKKLFTILNNLHESLCKGGEKAEQAKLLDELIDYTVDHFSTEEKAVSGNGISRL